MRLLNTDSFELEWFGDEDIPPFAILSHTWGDEEVTLQDMDRIHKTEKKGYPKIQNCCSVAKANGLGYAWIDTCCIDKTSSAELSEAINSMYRWYEEAEVCYAYLEDVPSKATFSDSRWFTRGWTLQELIAPSTLVFFDDQWDLIGTKADLRQIVSICTRIPVSMLSQEDDIETFSIAQRMSWASKRITTRIEDRAYCMLGIFGINMPLIYGERETAFIRLQEEILKLSADHSLFAWTSDDDRSRLLATSPAAFINSRNIVRYNPFETLNSPMIVTSEGIQLKLRFLGKGPRGFGYGVLHCKEGTTKDDFIAIPLRDVDLTMQLFERLPSKELQTLNLSNFRASEYPLRSVSIETGRRRMTRKDSKTLCEGSSTHSEDNSSDDIPTDMIRDAQAEFLLGAADSGLVDRVWLVLTRSDVKINFRDNNGRAAVTLAAMRGHNAIVKILLAQRDIDVNIKDMDGRTPLSWAAENGYTAVVNLLLMKNANPDAKDLCGRTPLWWAAAADEVVVSLLLGHGAVLNARDQDMQTPLMRASKLGRWRTVKLLLDYGTSRPVRDKSYNEDQILAAALYGYEAVVEVLLDEGVSSNPIGESGQTPLSWAAHNNHGAVVKLLIDKGVDIMDPERNNMNLAFWAARNRQEEVLEALLDKRRTLKYEDRNGRTALMLAAEYGHEKIIRLLLRKGADHRTRDYFGQTALLLAARNGHEGVVKLLLQKGASARIKDDDGQTPLFWATRNNNEALLRLLSKDADPSALNGSHEKSRSWAARLSTKR